MFATPSRVECPALPSSFHAIRPTRRRHVPELPVLRPSAPLSALLRHASQWGSLIVTSHESLASCVTILEPQRVLADAGRIVLEDERRRVEINATVVSHCEIGTARQAGWSWSIELSWFGDGRRRLGSLVLTDSTRIERALRDFADASPIEPASVPVETVAEPVAWRAMDNPKAVLIALLDGCRRDEHLSLSHDGRFSRHAYQGPIAVGGGNPARYSGDGFCLSLLLERVETLELGRAGSRRILRATDPLGCRLHLSADGSDDWARRCDALIASAPGAGDQASGGNGGE